jgi:UDP-N-acetylmuramate dehydrogenase
MKLPKNFKSNFNLKENNSLKLNYFCEYFVSCDSKNDLFLIHDFLKEKKLKFWIMGDGTNIILKNNLNGLVIKNNLKGFSIYKNSIIIGAGEIWDDVVSAALDKNLYGLENLSGIPGSVGASPIQNIGAYGSEVSNFVNYIETFNLEKGRFEVFSNEACNFSYRDSLFKNNPHLMITKVCLDLSNTFKPNTQYESLPKEVINAKEQRQNILSIRSLKLPNHKIIPNVGSFFKNPVISESKLDELVIKFPNIKSYLFKKNRYKVSAAWLIEEAGLKGSKKGDCGISDLHSLVFYNFSNQSDFLVTYSLEVKDIIEEKFGIILDYEPSIFS